MPRIFISYRRSDSAGYAIHLYHYLIQQFSKEHVFIDVGTIEPGENFTEVIIRAVKSCDVFIAVIGPQWLTISDTNGERRLDAPNDFVRIEIATALSQGIRVVPVLVMGASLPSKAELPDDIKALVDYQSLTLNDTLFQESLALLISSLKKITSTAPSIAEARQKTPYMFMSFSQKDRSYAQKLAADLKQKDCSVWLDGRFNYGPQSLPSVIQEGLDHCRAVILIMTPHAHKSPWVQRELSQAQRQSKIILPLLLDGMVWPSIGHIMHVDVQGGILPPPSFYSKVAQILGRV